MNWWARRGVSEGEPNPDFETAPYGISYIWNAGAYKGFVEWHRDEWWYTPNPLPERVSFECNIVDLPMIVDHDILDCDVPVDMWIAGYIYGDYIP